MINIEQGDTGLWYITDPENPPIFLAARSKQHAEQLLPQATEALLKGTDTIPNHALHVHETGFYVTVPTPDWMTPEQRSETIDRLAKHIAKRTTT